MQKLMMNRKVNEKKEQSSLKYRSSQKKGLINFAKRRETLRQDSIDKEAIDKVVGKMNTKVQFQS